MNLFAELKRRNVIRVGIAYALAGWLLLQVIDFVLEVIAAPAWILQVFFLAVAVGLPAVLVFAWVFEVTPEGIKRESEIDRSRSITASTGHKLDRVIIATLALAVAVLLLDRFLVREPVASAPAGRVEAGQHASNGAEDAAAGAVVPPRDSDTVAASPAIAVLPFVNMSADPQNEYFSDGVAEEILNVLARVPGLKVSARTSAFTYKGSKAAVTQIARELGVNHVLEGSVRRDGNQVRVTAQLIETETGFHLWSDTYDRELTNIFAIQDDIAQAIAAQLKVRLLPAADQPNLTGTADLEAYEHYLQGVSQWHARTGVSLENARELFERAIAGDPQFARAHAYLALTWAILHDYGDRPWVECLANARREAQAALALDPQSIEAATALIMAANDNGQQLEYARAAIALNPGFATTHQWFATALLTSGDVDGATREYRIAQELDPRSRIVAENLASLQTYTGQLDAAEATAQRTMAIAPDWYLARQRIFILSLLRGDRERAAQFGNLLAEQYGRTRNATPVYLKLFFDPGQRAAAAAEIAGYPPDRWDQPDNPSLIEYYDLPLILAAAGAHTEALTGLKWLQRNNPIGIWGIYRVSSLIPDFVCDPEVQAIYAATDLPPLASASPCEGRAP